jgi:hypothetical protein
LRFRSFKLEDLLSQVRRLNVVFALLSGPNVLNCPLVN